MTYAVVNPATGERLATLAAAQAGEHRAHRALRGCAYRFLRVLDLEHVVARIGHAPAHGVGKVDDVLIARQHVLAALAREFVGADLLDIDLGHARERRGQRQADAGFEHSGIAAKEGHHAALLRPDLWVADIVYRPLDTALLQAARAVGAPTLDGGHMAVYQAVDAFALITGLHPDADRMTRHFRQLVANAS